MTLNVAQYLAPLNGGQVLTGYVQGVKQGTGITILADGSSASGTISLNPAGGAALGFLTSSTAPAPVYNWATGPATPQSFLMNDSLGNLSWNTDYIPTLPVGQAFPHTGAAVLPAGLTGSRPAPQAGLLRYSTTFNRLEWSNGSAWLPLSPSSGGLFSFISNVTPTANAPGDFWLDTTINQEKIWDGVSWVPTTPLATALIPGRVKIGSNVQIAADGTISVLPVTGVAGGVSNLGLTTITDNVTSLSIDSALSANQGRLLQDQINALLITNNLTLAGLISGAGLMTYVTPEGALQGFNLGLPLPASAITNDGYFVIVDSAGGFTPPGGIFTTVTQGDWFLSTGTGWQFLNVGYDPPYATTTVPGIIEIATDAETQTGTDATRAVTPASLSSRTATETRTGIAQIATQAEANAGINDTDILTSLKLFGILSSGSIDANDILLNPVINTWTTVQQALNDAVYDVDSPQNTIAVSENPVGLVKIDVVQATETQRGGGEIATQIETNAGTSDITLLTPLKLAQYVASGQITAPEIPLAPPINGKTTVQTALEDAIYNVSSPGTTISIGETATGQVTLDVVQATETQLGGGEIATQAETETGTDDTRIVTPKKLRAATVYKSDFNAKGDILSATANDSPQILPVGTNGQVLTANSGEATGLKWVSPGIYNLDTITFDGVSSSYNLTIGGVPYAPTPTSNIMVFVGGVPQIPGAGNAYTVAGSVITFIGVPPVGASFYATTVRY